MGLFTWGLEKAKKLTIADWFMLKINLVLFGMILTTFICGFVTTYRIHFIVVWVVLEAILIYRLMKK